MYDRACQPYNKNITPSTTINFESKYKSKKEARKYSVNYRKRLDAHSNNLANALFKEQLGNRRVKRLYPADLATDG